MPIGKALARLIGVVDGAIDAVTEAELAREMDGQAPGREPVAVCLDAGHERAVIAGGEHVGDLVLEVEAFAEDQWRHACCSPHSHVPGDRRHVCDSPQRARPGRLRRRLRSRAGIHRRRAGRSTRAAAPERWRCARSSRDRYVQATECRAPCRPATRPTTRPAPRRPATQRRTERGRSSVGPLWRAATGKRQDACPLAVSLDALQDACALPRQALGRKGGVGR